MSERFSVPFLLCKEYKSLRYLPSAILGTLYLFSSSNHSYSLLFPFDELQLLQTKTALSVMSGPPLERGRMCSRVKFFFFPQ